MKTGGRKWFRERDEGGGSEKQKVAGKGEVRSKIIGRLKKEVAVKSKK